METWLPVLVQIGAQALTIGIIAVVFVLRMEGQVKVLAEQVGRLAESVSELSRGLGRVQDRVTDIERADRRKES